jgi:PmbA protein
MDKLSIKSSLEKLLAQQGIKDYEIHIMGSDSQECDIFQSDVKSFSSSTSLDLCLKVLVDGRFGTANTQDFSIGGLEELARKTVDNAKSLETEAEDTVLEAGVYQSCSNPVYPALASEQLRAKALEIQKSAYDADPRVIDGTETEALSVRYDIFMSNSKGVSLQGNTCLEGAFLSAVAKDDDDVQTAYCFRSGQLSELRDFDAVEKAVSCFGAVVPASGVYDIVFDTSCMRDFLSTFASVFYAKNAQLGLSLMAGKEGQAVSSQAVTLMDDPFEATSTIKISFDAEGCPTRTKAVIEDGVLKTLLYNSQTARKAKTQSTGNASGHMGPVGTTHYSFFIKPSSISKDDLLAKLGNGIYVSYMKGFHAGADASTGDFSIESLGFEVKDGKLGSSLKSFTVSGNFYEMLMKVEAVDDRLEFGIPSVFTRVGSPDLLVRGLSVAGK